MSLNLTEILTVGATAAICTVLVVGLFRLFDRSRRTTPRDVSPGNGLSFLISGDELLDATPEANVLLSQTCDGTATRTSVINALSPVFPDVTTVIANTPVEDATISANDGSATRLQISARDSTIRLSVLGPAGDDFLHLKQLQRANENVELDILRDATEHSLEMMWRTDAHGDLMWANSAYFKVTDQHRQGSDDNLGKSLPAVPLFPDVEVDETSQNPTIRTSIPSPDGTGEDWYDLTVRSDDTRHLYFAKCANDAVRAEVAQVNFMQTISQTFAQLSIGLAIFDRRRQLATFNPALLDMTSLPVDFLYSRPSLDMVLDRLREMRMLPEPKDYSQWRERFSRLETEALNGTYCENWNLPDGQTYRVTGRPHPNGAFALLLEDISAEISLTRRFRSEIETSQAVIDKIEDAIAVFSSGGNLVMSNTAYQSLWECENAKGLLQSDLRSEMRSWKSRCAPTRIWGNLREFINQAGERAPWVDVALLDDGRHIGCQAEPIQGGMTLVRFAIKQPTDRDLREITHKSKALLSVKG